MRKYLSFVGIIVFLCLSATFYNSAAQTTAAKITAYFNTPVNNTVSTGVNAVYLNRSMADTLVAYINRAKYSIDIAQYDYNQSSGIANIATAVNNCYTRGVKVRWIYDGSQSNTGLSLLNSGIPTLASPTTSSYGIMHNKFIIIDANSSSPDDAIVSTGSEDWGITQLDSDNNNLLFIQDSALAHAYLNEFNMMWGDTGSVANTTLSKFGPYKTDLGTHTFNIGNKTVELYFSPSDHTDSHIQAAINSANTDLYFGVYTFTESTDANDIVTNYNTGVYTAGIVDQYSSSSGSAYSILTSGLGSQMITYSNPTLVYHNKMLIVDPSNACSDPLVLTGSHNWTTSADTKNDENTLIIHSDTIANVYYQSFYANYTLLGGTLAPIAPCASCSTPTGISAGSITTTSAILSWAAAAGAVSYSVQYRQSGAATWNTTTTATNSVSLTALNPATAYEYEVKTICSSDSSSYTSSLYFTTLALPCTIPSGLATVTTTTSTAVVNWTTVAGAAGYNVAYRQTGLLTWNYITVSTNSITLTGLNPASNYQYKVQTICATDSSVYSLASGFTTLAPACTMPSGLTTRNITSSSATLAWTGVPGSVSYSVQYRRFSTTVWSVATSSVDTVNIAGLSPETTYEFEVQTVCAIGSSSYSGSSLFATPAVYCAVPTGLSANTINDTIILLTWNPVSSATGYKVNYRETGTTTWNTRAASGASLILTNLIPNATYEFEVEAICSATDSSDYGNVLLFPGTTSVGSVTAPADIQNLLISPNPTTDRITISFQVNEAESVNLAIYDMIGKQIITEENGSIQTPGEKRYRLQLPAPGIYFVKLTAGRSEVIRKVVKM